MRCVALPNPVDRGNERCNSGWKWEGWWEENWKCDSWAWCNMNPTSGFTHVYEVDGAYFAM